MRCKLLAALLLLGLMTIPVSNAFAVADWYVCTVKQTWTEPNGDVYFQCDSTTGAWSNSPAAGWFVVPTNAGNKNETLATLLTAQAGAMNVRVYTDNAALSFPNTVPSVVLFSN